MARRRFFVPGIHHREAQLLGEEAHHLARVLRVEPGERYEISDNRSVYLAEVAEARKDRVRFTIVEALPENPPPLELTLAPALIRFERLEWVLEKGTELGVSRFVPFAAGRSEFGLDRAARKRHSRWERILVESSQQSRRDRLPVLVPLARFDEVLAIEADARFLLDESARARPIGLALPARRGPRDRVALLAGPEGGWTVAEREAAVEVGWIPVSLGRQILRAETAALAATAILAAAWHAAQVEEPSGP